MNNIYQTNGFVLRSFPLKEHNKKLILLTEDFGVIQVNAQSVRKIESKLQPLIQDFSLSEVVLVFGRQGWKLTNAKIIKNLYYSLREEKIEILVRIFTIILRLIPEEQKHPEIFDIVKKSADFLEKNSNEEVVINYLEVVSILKILHQLGYIGENQDLQKYLDNDFELRHISGFGKDHKKCVRAINLAIKESHL